jgi:adenosylmethionine-8-amino-7-oxononanoate aminotransferase
MSCYEDNCPIIVDRAEGVYLIDCDGNKYIDGVSSLWANTLGHNVKELNDSIIKQLNKIAHSTLLGNSNTAVVELASNLSKVVPVVDPHFLFASDGASAVEQALKVAYQYWENTGKSRERFLTLSGAYHGDTIGAMSLGDSNFESAIFDPLKFKTLRSPGYSEPRWAELICKTIDENKDDIIAFVLEPLVQAAGGMYISAPNEVKKAVSYAQEKNIPVIADEIATGFGRIGKLFASEVCGINPDIMCLGKGLSAGYLPISITAVSDRFYTAFLGEDLSDKTFYHGHTFGGNALAAAVSSTHLELLLKSGILKELEKKIVVIKKMCEELREIKGVRDIRNCGFMTGVELMSSNKGPAGRLICRACVKKGVFLRPLGNTVVVMPPLVISEDEIRIIFNRLGDILKENSDLW